MQRLSQIIVNVREHFRAWLRVALILCALGFLFFVALGGVSHREQWRISQIDVVGSDTATSDIVRSLTRQNIAGNYYFVYARDNSYIFPRHEIEEMVMETFPRMRSVLAERTNDKSIRVTLAERKPYYLWCGDVYHPELSSLPACYFIDNTGYVFDRAPGFSRGVYLEIYGKLAQKNEGEALGASIPRQSFELIDSFYNEAQQSLGKPYVVEMKDSNEFNAVIMSSAEHEYLSDVTVRFNGDTTPDSLIKNLNDALAVQFPDNTSNKKKLLYIDMRFGNKVIFGFEN